MIVLLVAAVAVFRVATAQRELGAMSFGGIEAGGTHWNCAIGGGEGAELDAGRDLPDHDAGGDDRPRGRVLRRRARPRGARRRPLRPGRRAPRLAALGDDPDDAEAGLGDADVAGPLAEALGVPIALDTDVNAAAIGEWRHGAAQGLDTFVYVTVGTGIGGGVFANGRPVHGLLHPEVGHMLIPHDRARDPFEGCCPFHGDCLEGLASGTAMRERWGRPAEELTTRRPGTWRRSTWPSASPTSSSILSAERIVLGGGVGRAPGLVERVRARLREALAGYVDVPRGAEIDAYLVPPALGPRSGVVGALELARSR